jgi:iron(III) transport system substrate-binding protein
MLKKIVIIILILLVVLLSACLVVSLSKQERKIVVYVSHDQDYAEPILKDFEKVTGIKVEALYDTEATKTVGLVNRLIAEKNKPRADVFWNNEVMRSVMLKQEGILEPYCSPNAEDINNVYKDSECYWTGFAARARVILYNTEKMSEEPNSIYDFLDSRWKGETCMGNPVIGLTSTHMASIFALLGDDKAKEFFLAMKDNGIQIVASNSMVRDQVVAGECYFGLTDTDDAYDAITANKSVKMVFSDQGKNEIGDLIMPNSIMLIKGAPHKEEAKMLIDYILSANTEEMLAELALQMPLKNSSVVPKNVPDVRSIKPMNVSYNEMYEKLNVSNTFVQDIFLR